MLTGVLTAGVGWPAVSRTARPPVARSRDIRLSSEALSSVAWSRDGRRLAALDFAGLLTVADVATGKQRRRWRFPGGAATVAWRPDWKRFAVRRKGRRVEVWDAAASGVVRTFPRMGEKGDVAWSPDGERLAVADTEFYENIGSSADALKIGNKHRVRIFDVATGTQVVSFRHRVVPQHPEGHDDFWFEIRWRPDGKQIATSVGNTIIQTGPIRVWDAGNGKARGHMGGGDGQIRALAWRPDGQSLAASHGNRTVQVWRPATGRPIRRFEVSDVWWGDVAWQPSGNALAAMESPDEGGIESSNVQQIGIWNARTGKLARVIREKGVFLFAIAWSPDGRRLAAARSDGAVRLYSISVH